MKKISLQEIYNEYLGKVSFPDTCTIFFHVEEDKENLKTSPNKDFTAHSDSPKSSQIFYICPKCKGRCIQRSIGKSKVYDCQNCKDQISSEAVLVEEICADFVCRHTLNSIKLRC